MYTDGLVHAGKRRGNPMEIGTVIHAMLEDQDPSPMEISDALLSHAIALDEGRPVDDISVVTLKVVSDGEDDVRRMAVRLPISLIHET